MANSPKEFTTKKKTTSKTSLTELPTTSNKKSKKKSKQISNVVKSNPLGFILIMVCLIFGVVLGTMGVSVLTKNDAYYMNPYNYENAIKNSEGFTAKELFQEAGIEYENQVAFLFVNEEYREEGVTCISLGKDISLECSVEYYYRLDYSHEIEKVDTVDTSISGFYYAKYSTKSFKYANVELIRDIAVVEVELNG